MATRKSQKPAVEDFKKARYSRSIRIRDFFDTNVKTFSLYDNVRNIPKLTDGLKPSQRKAICGALSRGENAGEMQVERLASLIAAHTDYHHGAASLISTIVGMANTTMPGMNNMNLFFPSGQFGSRLTDSAGAGRYIFTRLDTAFRQLFKKEDDCILDPIIVDGEKIEPHTYIPLLPLSLVNGAMGTGTGHATNIKLYNPNDIRDAVLTVLAGKKLKKFGLTPWFRGYHGTVSRNMTTGQVITTGKLEVVGSTTIRITELPVGVYLESYKEVLHKLEEEGFIKDYTDSSTEESFNFEITAPRSTTVLDHETLLTRFKLHGRDTENFTLWNIEGNLQRFESPEHIIEAFVPWRLEQYGKRREVLLQQTTEQIRFQSEVIRFIRFYLSNTKTFKDTSKKELIELLLSKDFTDYDRLLSMQIWNLTKDKIAELEQKLADLKAYLAQLEEDTPIEMYKRELKAFKYEDN
jgi:DNA topoisomerase-2